MDELKVSMKVFDSESEGHEEGHLVQSFDGLDVA